MAVVGMPARRKGRVWKHVGTQEEQYGWQQGAKEGTCVLKPFTGTPAAFGRTLAELER